MNCNLRRVTGVFAFCAAFSATSMAAFAGTIHNTSASFAGPGTEPTQFLVKVVGESALINTDTVNGELLMEADTDEAFPLVEETSDGWLKVQLGEEEGYLQADESIELQEAEEEELAAASETAAASLEESRSQQAANAVTDRRQQVVDYAMQFLGCRYRYGGSNPLTGVDCSGFTSFVMLNGAGVSLPRTSRGQANAGPAVSPEQMQPGDLICYGSGRSINHVGMYIGNGQIIHASTESTGVKISPWNYRTPVKIVNVLG